MRQPRRQSRSRKQPQKTCHRQAIERTVAFWLRSHRYARLSFADARENASAGAWNFGLCATRSREPRQARKGATEPGMPRVPQITRSSSRRKKLSAISFQSSVRKFLDSKRLASFTLHGEKQSGKAGLGGFSFSKTCATHFGM